MEKWDHHTVSRTVECHSYIRKQLNSVPNVTVTIWPRNSTPRYILKKNKNLCSHKKLGHKWTTSIIHNSQRITKMPIIWWSDQQSVVYTCNGVSLINKKDKCIDIRYNINKPWKYYAKWRKSVTKDYLVWFHLYEKSRINKSMETKGRLVVSQSWEVGLEKLERNGDWLPMGVWWKCSFRSDENVLKLFWWLYNTVNTLKTNEMCTSNRWMGSCMDYLKAIIFRIQIAAISAVSILLTWC